LLNEVYPPRLPFLLSARFQPNHTAERPRHMHSTNRCRRFIVVQSSRVAANKCEQPRRLDTTRHTQNARNDRTYATEKYWDDGFDRHSFLNALGPKYFHQFHSYCLCFC
jgi:hypothetical protein